ncbi:endo-1,4-beta-xylanase [Rhizomicrobium palustre]|uniref:Beta-xylanase n=1 Tax=Rhizomicrobium palustre TaxID=189966 RepID=A0A846MZQ5_9PROT|nr:endo-1,4-beta-xylanase [Rhizomicrobium palustre]NIK88440.1 endo-1,4-beta-xylanase [Rhizomicrobium palustre]
MTSFSRRNWLLCAGAFAAEGAFAGAPKREKKHGRGHIHHHTNFEAAGSAPDSLNGLAVGKGLAFGACIGTASKKPPLLKSTTAKPAKPRPAAFDDPQLRGLFVSQCGILVPENELKWYVVRPGPKTYDFARADMLMAFAAQYKLAVRGHTLLWNRSKWSPEWLNSYDFGSKPVAEAERLLKDHIKTVATRYGEHIFSYDVVNETIAPATGEMEDAPFTKVLGPEVVDLAFRLAREAAPKAQLVYNDYMGWAPKDAAHRAGVLKLLERLKKNNVPIDALGLQSHIDAAAISGGVPSNADLAEWKKFLDAVVAMGLDIIISEFDVNDKGLTGSIAERDRAVADYAKVYLDTVLAYPQTRYVMAWGLADRYSWLQGYAARPDGLPQRCLPYDDSYRPKALRQAMADAFAAAPARPLLPLKPA